jgi:hypothetical protein
MLAPSYVGPNELFGGLTYRCTDAIMPTTSIGALGSEGVVPMLERTNHGRRAERPSLTVAVLALCLLSTAVPTWATDSAAPKMNAIQKAVAKPTLTNMGSLAPLAPIPTTAKCTSVPVSIQAYDVSTFSLRANGSVWSWGNNSNGQLGDGTTTTRSTPVQVVGPGGSGYLQGIVSLADGNGSAAGLSSDGTVYAWGSGILGNNTRTVATRRFRL